MDLDFRKLDAHKLFDFSKEEEQLIFEIYDKLFEVYNISVIHIEDSLYSKFSSDIQNPFHYSSQRSVILLPIKTKNILFIFL